MSCKVLQCCKVEVGGHPAVSVQHLIGQRTSLECARLLQMIVYVQRYRWRVHTHTLSGGAHAAVDTYFRTKLGRSMLADKPKEGRHPSE